MLSLSALPKGLDMSDFWVVQVMKSNLKPLERRDKYPAVSASKYLKGSPNNGI